MTLCPVAIAVGCKKCPVFNVCPVKGIIGDYKEGEKSDQTPKNRKTSTSKAKGKR
jgi:hypothetical protein